MLRRGDREREREIVAVEMLVRVKSKWLSMAMDQIQIERHVTTGFSWTSCPRENGEGRRAILFCTSRKRAMGFRGEKSGPTGELIGG